MVTKRRAVLVGGIVAALASVGIGTVALAAPSAAPSDPVPAAGTAVKKPGALRELFEHTTIEQRACLATKGLTAPEGKLTAEQRKALLQSVKTAADACGVKIPHKPKVVAGIALRYARLTPAQQTCVAGINISRPVGKLTAEQRKALATQFKSALTACGIN